MRTWSSCTLQGWLAAVRSAVGLAAGRSCGLEAQHLQVAGVVSEQTGSVVSLGQGAGSTRLATEKACPTCIQGSS